MGKEIRTYRLPIILIGILLSVGAAQAQDSETEHARQLLLPFKKNLQTALLEGMAQGPVNAIDACHLQAPEIANDFAPDVQVGRTSDRLRNPDNASPDWVSPILEKYLASTADREPQIVMLDDNRVGYVEPIVLKSLCITCHGKELAPEIATRIHELYPDDRAIDYEIGDLRGVFWIDFPAQP